MHSWEYERRSVPSRDMRSIGAAVAVLSTAIARMDAAMPAIVGAANKRNIGNTTPKLLRTRAINCVPKMESPPSSKKSLLTPTSSTPRTSRQMAASRFSMSVEGVFAAAWAVGASAAPASPSFSAKPMRCGLPVGPFGISLTKTTWRGTLNSAKRRNTNSRSSMSVDAVFSRSTMATPTSSPRRSSGTANAIACATAGCSSSTSSISLGEIFFPPRLIISLVRPVRNR